MPAFLVVVFFILFIPFSSARDLSSLNSSEDTINYVIINKIILVGNKKTKDRIILRELNFKEGDTLSVEKLNDVITKSRNRIFNTNLFITVDLTLAETNDQQRTLLITVKERWYTYPIPIFELADRNFNEWWQQRGRDPSRVNYGILFIQQNTRGRNETLRAKLQLGFTKKFELFYLVPYINKAQTIGLNFDISYIINKQIAFKTSEHKLTYFEGDDYIRDKFRTGISFSYRKKFYRTHLAGISYYNTKISDTVAHLNPNYFLDSQTTQQYFSLKYIFLNDLRDITYYPLNGSLLRFEAEKLGTGIFDDVNQVIFMAEYSSFKKLGKKIYLATSVKQKLSFPIRQPYFNIRALGYEKDYVSGYELYVIDGQNFSLAKVNLKWQLYSNSKNVQAVPVNQFETIPFAIYLKAHSDAGYVKANALSPENKRLSNKFLLGGGMGIDFVSYYDLVLRLEYSVNIEAEHGFFVHLRSAI
jgi:outer membrane protein assembly factor BamA